MGVHLWLRKFYGSGTESVANQEEIDESKLPSFWLIVGIILIPLVLIILDSICGVVPALAGVAPVFEFLGEPFVALLLATLAAMFGLGLKHGYTMKELEKVMTILDAERLILLVTACGGVLRYVLQYSGLGNVIGKRGCIHESSDRCPCIYHRSPCPYQCRFRDGCHDHGGRYRCGASGNQRAVPVISGMYVAAVAGGSTVCSHFNDSGFWLVRSLVGIDEKTTLKTWTIMETLVGVTGFLVALVISFFA